MMRTGISRLKGSPADPNRLYASQSSGWFGQVIQRSNDGGKTWEPAGNEFVYDGVPGTHLWYDSTPRPWEFKLEARYPVLRGTIRDQVTGQRRAFVRFFACGQDLSHEPPDAPLPDAVAMGAEPFLIVGAMAGG